MTWSYNSKTRSSLTFRPRVLSNIFQIPTHLIVMYTYIHKEKQKYGKYSWTCHFKNANAFCFCFSSPVEREERGRRKKIHHRSYIIEITTKLHKYGIYTHQIQYHIYNFCSKSCTTFKCTLNNTYVYIIIITEKNGSWNQFFVGTQTWTGSVKQIYLFITDMSHIQIFF